MFVVKYRDRMRDGLLHLRDLGDDGDAHDLPILKEWKSARALLQRFKTAAAPLLNGQPAEFGKVWIETLPGMSATPWEIHEDEYAQAHIRTRTVLIVTPENYTHSGLERISLGVGVVNLVEHRTLHCETNFGTHPRTHLIVDVKRLEQEVES